MASSPCPAASHGRHTARASGLADHAQYPTRPKSDPPHTQPAIQATPADSITHPPGQYSGIAPLAGQDERRLRGELTLLTWPFNVLGAPALALPCGSAEDGLPASIQLVGREGADGLVLAVGSLLASLV